MSLQILHSQLYNIYLRIYSIAMPDPIKVSMGVIVPINVRSHCITTPNPTDVRSHCITGMCNLLVKSLMITVL